MEQIIDFFIKPYLEKSIHLIILELIASIFGVVSVVYAKKGNILVYPTGILSTVISIYLALIVPYYGDFIIYIYYTLMSIYGWYLWSNVVEDEKLPISWCSKKDWVWVILIFAFSSVFVILVYLIFDRFQDIYNYLDVITTGLAFASMWLMAKKKVENWIGWIIVDFISVPLYFVKDYGFYGIQFLIFLILAFQGYYLWRDEVRRKSVKTQQ